MNDNNENYEQNYLKIETERQKIIISRKSSNDMNSGTESGWKLHRIAANL